MARFAKNLNIRELDPGRLFSSGEIPSGEGEPPRFSTHGFLLRNSYCVHRLNMMQCALRPIREVNMCRPKQDCYLQGVNIYLDFLTRDPQSCGFLLHGWRCTAPLRHRRVGRQQRSTR